MKLKPIVTGGLLVFVAASLVFLVVDEATQRGTGAGGDASSQADAAENTPGAGPSTPKPAGEPTVKQAVPVTTTQPAVASETVIAYYFYTTMRCPSCHKIETWSHEAVEKGFAPAIKAKRLVWRMVNVDEPKNKHFVKDYQLYTKSVVLVAMRDGRQTRWKNLPKVWELLGSKAAFQTYVQTEARAFSPALTMRAAKPTPAKPVAPARQVTAYYFHTTMRCPSCRKIEAWSREAVHREFAPDLKAERLVWRMVNVDEPKNKHFVQDYKLYTKSLVLVGRRDGKQTRWKNLPKVWELLGNKATFQTYVRDQVRAFLEGN